MLPSPATCQAELPSERKVYGNAAGQGQSLGPAEQLGQEKGRGFQSTAQHTCNAFSREALKT